MSITSNRSKFQVQKKVRDFTSKMARVINETSCTRHTAKQGEPCYWVPKGVCNHRAQKIYTGVPSDRASMGAREYKRAQKENVA